MWKVLTTRDARKAIDALPPQVAEKYAAWTALVAQMGPQALRSVKSFHDEKLSGKLSHLRSSRLNLQWRVIYSVRADVVTVSVERVTPHDYRP